MNKSGANRQRDTGVDTMRGRCRTNALKVMEAGTGIEPVYTDLQANKFPGSPRPLAEIPYQDKPGTIREQGTVPAHG